MSTENTNIEMTTTVESDADITVKDKANTEITEVKQEYKFENTKERLKEVMGIYEDDAAALAKYLGLSYQSLNKKLNGHVDFKRGEIRAIADRYNLNAEMIYYVFFAE